MRSVSLGAARLAALMVAAVAVALATVASADGVYCGNENRLCPSRAPICCGRGSHYCVPAGFKCCDASSGGPAAACRQSEQCCPGFYTSTCCAAGQTCTTTSLGFGECVTDTCATRGTQDSCLGAGAGGECGWCCREHRCVSLRPGSSRQPTCSTPPLTDKSQKCPSRCYDANTCGLCTAEPSGVINSSESGQDDDQEQCAWCCATMSCMPASSTADVCPNQQYTISRDKCHGCYSGGRGVSEYISDSATFYPLGACIAMAFAFVCSLVCGRVVYSVFSKIEKPSAEQLQEAVRRYGFAVTDLEPMSPLSHHGGGGGTAEANAAAGAGAGATTAATTATNATKQPTAAATPGPTEVAMLSTLCAACKAPIRLTDLEAHLSSSQSSRRTKRDASPSPSAPVEEGSTAPDNGDAPQSGSTGPALPGEQAPLPPPESKDDPAAIFLPCGHCCCYACAGASRSASAPADQSPQAAQAEEAIKKKRKGKCPACKAKYTDILLTEKVRNI